MQHASFWHITEPSATSYPGTNVPARQCAPDGLMALMALTTLLMRDIKLLTWAFCAWGIEFWTQKKKVAYTIGHPVVGTHYYPLFVTFHPSVVVAADPAKQLPDSIVSYNRGESYSK